MPTAIKKFIVYCLLFVVYILPLVASALTFSPKEVYAACPSSEWGWQISVASISGSTVNYNITPNSGSGSKLVLTDLGLTDPNREQAIPDNVASFTMTHPNGTHQPEVAASGVCKSNTLTITLPSTGLPLPPTSTGTGTCATGASGRNDAIDTLNRCYIELDAFDDKAFGVNLLAGQINAANLFLTGKDIMNPGVNNVTQGQGALNATGHMVAGLYGTPPVSGVQYFASQIDKFNPVQPAYAQGIGFSALQPVQTIWEAFRNLSYIGFVIVFVIIGFMIMFRAKISPQAVATVQDSLPRIVIALILVTFSYAIAGLLIDIMFLFLNIIINALKAVGLLTNQGDIVFTKSVFGVVWGSWKDTFGTVAEALNTLIDDILDLPLGLDKVIGFLGGGIAALVVGIAMIFVMFRVFFMLLIAYATIVILTIAAPFYFLFQALPGNNGAKDWFKQMTANVAVFPATALMFILAGILGGIGALGGSAASQIGGGNVGQFPLLAGDIDTNAIGKLIGLGILLMTPNAADMIKKAIGATGGVGGAAGGAFGALGAGAGVAFAGARKGFAGAQESLPQQLESKGFAKNAVKWVNPAYYKARGMVSQEKRQEKIKEVAGTSILNRKTSTGSGGSGGGVPS